MSTVQPTTCNCNLPACAMCSEIHRHEPAPDYRPTTLDELETEGNKENLGGFGGDFQARKKLQEMLQDMACQTEKMINDAVSNQEAIEAEKEANEWYERRNKIVNEFYARQDKMVEVVNSNKKEVVAGSVVTAATVAGVVFAPGYAAKAAVVMAGVAALGVGFYFRNKLFNK
jgi:hypothetical protein